MFVNREAELAALNAWWERPGAAIGVVWGRRRVGKSWLLREWASSRRSVFHIARNRPMADELRALSLAVSKVAGAHRRNLTTRPFHDWDDAFDVLSELSTTEPLLVVIDEFPDLIKSTPGLESAFRAIWERVEPVCNLRLVLCGSAVRTMEALQTQQAPLHNRMTLRLPVHPFSVHEVSRMLPSADPLERAAAWGICGGMPFYLSVWEQGRGLRANVEKLFCNERALLLSEGEFVLTTEDVAGGGRERLPEQVLRAIAAGHTSFREITAALNTLPTRVLVELERLRLVARVQPVTEKPTTKLSYYRVDDNFLEFWLTMIEPHRSAIEQGLGSGVASVVLDSFDDHMGARWEEALRQHVRFLAAADRIHPGIVAVGEFWNRQVGPNDDPCQLDVVAVAGRGRQVALVGEATWSRRKAAPGLLSDIKSKAGLARLSLADDPVWLVCARDVLTQVPEGVMAVTAHDIFA